MKSFVTAFMCKLHCAHHFEPASQPASQPVGRSVDRSIGSSGCWPGLGATDSAAVAATAKSPSLLAVGGDNEMNYTFELPLGAV